MLISYDALYAISSFFSFKEEQQQIDKEKYANSFGEKLFTEKEDVKQNFLKSVISSFTYKLDIEKISIGGITCYLLSPGVQIRNAAPLIIKPFNQVNQTYYLHELLSSYERNIITSMVSNVTYTLKNRLEK